MYKNLIPYILLLLVVCHQQSFAQSCECTNCPDVIPVTSTTVFDFEVNGATNNDLSDPGQGVCGVYISFEHEFIWNIEMVLTSPGGQQVTLVGPNVTPPFGSYTGFSDWLITFLPCGDPVIPDPGFNPIWSNDQSWLSLQEYTGSYYPYSGCLEDFNTGVVDGTWTLTVDNNNVFYTGEVLDFEMIFCDTTGMDCFLCEADAGDLSSYPDTSFCEGDVNLLLDVQSVYTGTVPDSTIYGFYYVLLQDDIILDYDTLADLQNYASGTYQVCGLSYLYDDSLSIPNPNGVLTWTDLEDDLNMMPPMFCGNLSDTCILINVLSTGNTITDTICAGESFPYNGNQLDTTGIYTFVFPSTIGCGDSTVVINLTVEDSIQQNISEIICEGETYSLGGQNFTITGQYSLTLPAGGSMDCDTFVMLDLVVSDTFITNLSEVICEGESFIVGDSVYTETGIYANTFLAVNTCDSIVNLDLTVNSMIVTNLTETICEGESYFVGDSIYTITGSYIDTLMAVNACDSIINLDLTVNTSVITNLAETICQGESYSVGDSSYTLAGNYSDTLTAVNTCDSIVNLTLVVNAAVVTNLAQTICEGESFMVGDSVYTMAGNYSDTLVAFNTCDSIVNLDLAVNSIVVTNLVETICEGGSFMVGDSVYTMAGNYSDTLIAFNTCDSIVNLDLAVNAIVVTNLAETICEGESFMVGDSAYTISGNYSDTLAANTTCDSVVNLILAVNSSVLTNLTETICEGESYSVGDSIYTSSGNYSDTLVAFNTCDSVVNLTLAVNSSVLTNLTETICEGESYSVGNSVYTFTGNYSDTLAAFNTCDSIINLDLTANALVVTNLTEVICEGESYSVGDSVYTSTGSYSDTLVAINTCDSIVNLLLTVNALVVTNLAETICEGESFSVGDSVYTSTGSYSDTLVAINTCDSIVNLNLTVNTPTVTNLIEIICAGGSYVVGDSVYTLAGSYSDTLTAINTCDSIVNLNLTVNATLFTNLVETICEGESYFVGDSVYTATGNYIDTLTAFNTCDSIVNLSLTVNASVVSNLSETICEGESYSIGDSIYTIAGNYSDTLMAFNNCDSIINLVLIVNPAIINNITATICNGESYTVGDSMYSVSGFYNDTLTALNTCDSIINLNLTVSNFYETNLVEVICEGESYTVGDSVYTLAGNYINSFVAINGCDSIVNLDLTVNLPLTINLSESICEGDSYMVGDSVYTLTGNYSNTFTAFNSCDSIVNLALIVNMPVITNLSEVICAGESYAVGDSTYVSTGNHTNIFIGFNTCDSIVNLNLTVSDIYETNLTETICEGESYSVGDSVYTSTGSYSDTLVAINTCDSIVNLLLTVNALVVTNLAETICEGESFSVGDSVYTSTGSYSDTLVAINTCDSIVNLNLTVNTPTVTNLIEIICAGGSYVVGDSVYTLAGSYSDTLTAINTCDSIVNLNLTVNATLFTNLVETICEGESYFVGDSVYTATGNYIDTLTAFNTCDSIVNLSLTVNASVVSNLSETICEGESYSIGDSIYTIAGNYSDTLMAFNNCDSIINLVLIVNPAIINNITATICNGESYTVGDSMYSVSGFYNDTLTALNTCDSIINLNLTVSNFYETNLVEVICEGESYTVGDSVYTLAGNYINSFVAINGCDSIVNLDLTVNLPLTINLSESICEGDSYMVGDSVYTLTGNYSNTFTAFNSCDSIVNLALIVNMPVITNLSEVICAGESYAVGDSTYVSTGNYTNIFIGFNTCDSIVNLNLTVSDIYETNLTETICEGESFTVGDSVYTETGTYSNSFVAVNLCDSLVNLSLTVNAPVVNNITATICESESYTVGDSVYTATGNYSNTLTAFNTCDSIVNLNLTVSDFYETNLTETICEGESFLVGDSVYTETGTYSNSFVAVNLCDSLVNLSLTVNAPVVNNITATICESESYTVGDSVYTATGNYSNTLTAFNTCDSIVNLNLTVSDFYETNLTETICEGESFLVGDSVYTETGTYSNSFVAVNLCDSLVNLSLTVNAPVVNNITATICESESYTVGDSVYTATGNYSNTLTAFNTCDSIVNLNLTVSDFYETNLTETICEGESFLVGDSVYTETGTYSNSFVAVNLCDSLVNLSLTVNAPVVNNITATICESESYTVGDSVYTATGNYSNILTAFNTCDSIVNLNLTVSDFYETNLTETICEGESFLVGDSVYTETGTYSNSFVAVNLCDSLVNLSLTVNAPVVNNITATICESESYTVGDSVYTVTGNYSNTLTAFNTCDSLVNLNLTVSDFYETNLTETICEGESFTVGDSVYTETGTYSNSFVAVNLCDSLVNLSLAVNAPVVNNITATICESESYTVGDSVYTVTGNYSNILTAFNTCDSIVNLNLTVSDFYETNLTETICEGESFLVGDSVYTETGTYSNSFVAVNLCDSLVNLSLTVNAPVVNNITATICESESYTVGDSVYTATGNYSNTLTAFNTCDSIVNLNLTVSDFYETNLTETICEGESFLVGDSVYTETGTYSNSFVAVNLCDSLVNLSLTVNAPVVNNITATICESESYTVGDSVYTVTGNYSNILTAFNTCDSLVNLNLTVSDFYETNLTETICEGESFLVGDSVYTETGTYSNSFVAVNLCDSLVNLSLTVNAPVVNNITATICESESYTVGDSVYTATGNYSNTLTAFNTCDSIVNLNLTVSDFYETNLTETICEGESFLVGDSVYTETGTYSNSFVAVNLCDSLVNLSLTVNAPVVNNITATICESESYTVGDSVYTATGNYSNTLTAFNTCDSIVNLNLTVSDFYETNLTETICEGESFLVGDSVYTETGTYSNSFVAVNLCDSLVNLSLTVNAPVVNNITATICESESYTVGDSVYTATGNYSNTLTAFNTCDSIVNLNLTVSDFYETNLTETICEGESFLVGDSVYTETGTYSNSFVAVNLCDSLVNLSLTVNAPVVNNITATICESESYTVGDSVYTATGNYSNTLTAFNTCDSIVNLNLTVSDFYETNLTETICEGESFLVGDSVYTETGTYSNSFVAVNLCDSLVNLSLAVNAPVVNNITATICESESYTVGDSVYTVTGNYSNILTAFNTCDSIINLDLIVLSPVVTIDFPDTLNCGETEVFLNATVFPSTSNSSLAVEWTHLNNGGNGIIGGANSPLITVNKSGLYEIILTETYLGVSCIHVQTITVEQDTMSPIALINALNGTSLDCNQNSLILTGQDSQSVGNAAMVWLYNGQPFSTDVQVEVEQAGEYMLIVSALLNSCSDTALINVDQDVDPPIAQVVSEDTIACSDASVSLNGSGSSVGNNISYLWTTNDGNITGNSDSLFPEVDQAGTYILIVTDIDNGCTATEAVVVTEDVGRIESVLLDLGMPSCPDLADGWVAITSWNGGVDPVNFIFNEEEGGTPFWTGLTTGTYSLIMEDGEGCQWDTVVTLLSPGGVLLTLGDDLVVQLGDSVVFEALTIMSEALIDTLIWSPAGLLSCDSCYQQSYTPLETVRFTAMVIDENGCRSEDDILIQVIKDRLIFIPNAFSPNGDGRNDLFMINGGKGVEQINTFQIYDRYGALLFRANDFHPNDPAYAWDGYHKGQALNPGVFVFYAEVLFSDGHVELYKGDITIVK